MITIQQLKDKASTAGELAIIEVIDQAYQKKEGEFVAELRKKMEDRAEAIARDVEEVTVAAYRAAHNVDPRESPAHTEARLNSDRQQLIDNLIKAVQHQLEI